MTDHSDLPRDDGRIWGHIEDGIFRPLPKRPMVDGGWGPVPFDVVLPDGRIRHVIAKPDDAP